MLKPVGPMSNTERQRKFRERHPGYFRKYYARKRAAAKRADWEIRAMVIAQAQAAAAAAAAPETRPMLMLPAPVELPVIPGLNAIATTPAPAPLPVLEPLKLAA